MAKKVKGTLAGDYRQKAAIAMFNDGESLREIANTFGVSYEWTRRVCKQIEYKY